jgi:hypothetical protein
MYVNGRMRPVETILGMGGVGIGENDGGGKFNYDILRTFVNVTLYPQYNNKKIHNKLKEINTCSYLNISDIQARTSFQKFINCINISCCNCPVKWSVLVYFISNIERRIKL